MFYETGLQYSLNVQMERLAEELPGRVHGQQCLPQFSAVSLLTEILASHYAIFGENRYLAVRRVGHAEDH